jgi:Tol biopolymer transport system component
LISADYLGRPSTAIGPYVGVNLSADGRFIAFSSFGPLTRSDHDTLSDVYIRDRTTGTLRWLTAGQTNPFGSSLGSSGPAITANGRHVAFTADTTNLAPGGESGRTDIYRWRASS